MQFEINGEDTEAIAKHNDNEESETATATTAAATTGVPTKTTPEPEEPKAVPSVNPRQPSKETQVIKDPVMRSQSVVDVKYTRIMRIGKYQPQKYTTSPPAPPEGYTLDVKVWNDILEDSKRMSASIRKHYKEQHKGYPTSSTSLSSSPNSISTPTSSVTSVTPPPPQRTAEKEDDEDEEEEKEEEGCNSEDDVNYDVIDDDNDIGENLRLVEVRRKAEIENRKLRKRPVGIWQKAQEKINFALADVAYGFNRFMAKAQDEARREIRDRTVQRFEELDLTVKELEAAGSPLADFYCRAVVEAPVLCSNGSVGDKRQRQGKTAVGWLFITEKLVIFDGYRVCLPTVPLEGDGHYRFSFQLTKIASFIGAKWSSSALASATGEVPSFTYDDGRLKSPLTSPVKEKEKIQQQKTAMDSQNDGSKSEEKDSAVKSAKPSSSLQEQLPPQQAFGKKKELGDHSEDAVLIFDQDTMVHQFWDFDQCLANDSRSMMCLLNTAWRTAMLARLN